MKTLLRWIIRLCVTLLFLVVLLAIVVLLLKDPIAKALAERNLRNNTGMDAKIARMEIGLATPTVHLEGLKLYNTADFGGGTFLDLPELRVEYTPDAVREGQVRFKTVRLNLAEVHVVKGKNGRTNIEMMQKASRERSGRKGSGDSPGMDFGGIDSLYLTVGRIRITDESDPRNNDVIEVGLKEEVGKNLKNEAEITQWFSGVVLKLALRDAMSGSRSSQERWQKLIKVFGVRF
jgi:uncharacterized protein involved in outer membrane biogenesis